MEKWDKTNILLTMLLLVLIICNLTIYNNKILTPSMKNEEIIKQYEQNIAEKKAEEEAKLQDDEMSKEDIDAEQLANLKSMGEADRMYIYFYNYITLVESGKYEEAYNLLYSDFKTQYFPTLETYTTYVQNRYPQFMSVEYESIERQGEYYILTVIIRDDIVTENSVTLKQKFVMHEKGFNDIELSFQVM